MRGLDASVLAMVVLCMLLHGRTCSHKMKERVVACRSRDWLVHSLVGFAMPSLPVTALVAALLNANDSFHVGLFTLLMTCSL